MLFRKVREKTYKLQILWLKASFCVFLFCGMPKIYYFCTHKMR